jgi:hypothetical protein
MRTYTAYSIGVGIAWAIVLALASALAPAGKRNSILRPDPAAGHGAAG